MIQSPGINPVLKNNPPVKRTVLQIPVVKAIRLLSLLLPVHHGQLCAHLPADHRIHLAVAGLLHHQNQVTEDPDKEF